MLAAGAACAGRDDAATVADELARARASTTPLYYAGDEAAGLPLTGVQVLGPGRAVFLYGTCEIPAERTEGGCAVPIQVQQFPFERAQWSRATGCRAPGRLLGVPTAFHDGLVLFSGRSVVKVYARSRAEARRIALGLRPVGGDQPVRRLPPPAREARELVARVCRESSRA